MNSNKLCSFAGYKEKNNRIRIDFYFIVMSKKQKRILSAVIISIVSVVLIVFLTFFMKGNPQEKKYRIDFLNQNTSFIDSSLQTMSINEKLAQLLLYIPEDSAQMSEITAIQDRKLLPAGVSVVSDSLERYFSMIHFLNAKQIVTPFIISSGKYPSLSFAETPFCAPMRSLFYVSNDSLVNQYFQDINRINSFMNINLIRNDASILFDNQDFNHDTLSFQSALQLMQKAITLQNAYNQISCLYHFNSQSADHMFSDSAFFLNFKDFVNNGLAAIWLDTNNRNNDSLKSLNMPYSEYLEKAFGFYGLLIAEINSEKLSKTLILNAFKDGANLIAIKNKYKQALQLLHELYSEGLINDEQINARLKKTLLARSWVKVYEDRNFLADTLPDYLYQGDFVALNRQIIKESILLSRNDSSLLPLKRIQDKNIFVYVSKKENYSDLFETMKWYKNIAIIESNSHSTSLVTDLYEKHKNKTNDVIVLIDNFPEADTAIQRKISEVFQRNTNSPQLVVVSLKTHLHNLYLDLASAIIISDDTSQMSKSAVAQMIFGGIGAKAKSPYTFYANGKKIDRHVTAQSRLEYAIPEEVGIASSNLSDIYSIVNDGIRMGAMPGCQIFVAKEGKVIFNEAFGFTNYGRDQRINTNSMYDIASLTKIFATTLATMKMTDLGRIHLTDKLSRFFKDKKIDYKNIKADTIINVDTFYLADISSSKMADLVRNTDTLNINDSMFVSFDTLFISLTPKNNIFTVSIKELLLHKSGLPPGLPILRYIKYKNDTANYFNEYYSRSYHKDTASIKIADGLYFKNRYFDTLWRDAKRMKVSSRKNYQYSDANMILLQMALDSLNKRSLNSFVSAYFYTPLGLKHIGFKPLWSHTKYEIVPTENDNYWRKQLLRGNVHDPTAALYGGVAGNAGLFANAADLGVILQMLLNNGYYGGQQYLSKQVVKTFTQRHNDGHRGLGFDMKHRKSIIAASASDNSYGHTGFTGTCFWVDPDEQLIFVFLSNRVHPSVKNFRLNHYKIRERVHQTIYNAIHAKNKKKTTNKTTA